MFYDKHAKELKDPNFGKHLPTVEPYTIMNHDADSSTKSLSQAESGTGSLKARSSSPPQLSTGNDGSHGSAASFDALAPKSGEEDLKAEEQSATEFNSMDTLNLTYDSGFKSSSLSALRAHIATYEAEKRKQSTPDPNRPEQLKKAAPASLWPSMITAKKKKSLHPPLPDFSGPVVRPSRPSILRAPPANEIPSELDNHHLYVDHTGYPYDCKLVRIDPRINENERYILKIFESHTVPHTYALHQRYAKIRQMPRSEILVPIGSDFTTVFNTLRDIFEAKTGKKWEDRMKAGMMAGGEDECADDGGKPFMFLTPEKWEPTGQMPWNKDRKAATAGVAMMGTSGILLPPNVVRES
jgi:hypothetical protein